MHECFYSLEPVREADVRVLRGCGHGFCHKVTDAIAIAFFAALVLGYKLSDWLEGVSLRSCLLLLLFALLLYKPSDWLNEVSPKGCLGYCIKLPY